MYHTDRFSHTGASAVAIVDELRRQHGIAVYSIMQPADSFEHSGKLQQNIQLIIVEYDNDLRKTISVQGMADKFLQGIWIVKPPRGYDIIKINDDRRIEVNEEGRKLQKALRWKLQGMKHGEIIERLHNMGVEINYKLLYKIFRNPFYCGLIGHGLLDGEIIPGKHEALITPDEFLRINEINAEASGYGVSHKKEDDHMPLKIFARCSCCNVPITGYYLKKKGIHYYKCRTPGCKFNKNAQKLNDIFVEMLDDVSIDESSTDPLRYDLLNKFEAIGKEDIQREMILKGKLTELEKKIMTLEEEYYILKTMNEEPFKKFQLKYAEEKKEIIDGLRNCVQVSSNLEKVLETILKICGNPSKIWASGTIRVKERLQKTIFPEGIVFDRKNGVFRTPRINSVFVQVDHLAREKGQKERGQLPFLNGLSPLVRKRRLPRPSSFVGRNSVEKRRLTKCKTPRTGAFHECRHFAFKSLT